MAKSRALPVVGTPPRGGVPRRDVLQGLLTGVGAGLAVPGLAAAHPLVEHAHHPRRIADAQAKARQVDGESELLDPYQTKMLESLAERIVPGAGEAGCARFVDSLLAVGEPDDTREFLSALGAIDAEARARFARPWPELDAAEQDELLSAASTGETGTPDPGSWAPGTPVADYLPSAKDPVAVHSTWAQAEPPRRVTLRDHFDHLKGWVVGAYYSSETGLRDLGYAGPYFAESFPGCTHPDGHRES